jgi:hypothetical protein
MSNSSEPVNNVDSSSDKQAGQRPLAAEPELVNGLSPKVSPPFIEGQEMKTYDNVDKVTVIHKKRLRLSDGLNVRKQLFETPTSEAKVTVVSTNKVAPRVVPSTPPSGVKLNINDAQIVAADTGRRQQYLSNSPPKGQSYNQLNKKRKRKYKNFHFKNSDKPSIPSFHSGSLSQCM